MQADRPKIGVGVMVKNHNNEFLLSQRLSNTGYAGAGKWCFPGGHVEFGESLFAAAIREVKEETNIDLNKENLTLYDSFSQECYTEKRLHYFTFYVIALAEHKAAAELCNMEPEKHSDWSWFNQHNMPDDIWFPTDFVIEGKEIPKRLYYW